MERFRPALHASGYRPPESRDALLSLLPGDVIEDASKRLLTIAAAISTTWVVLFLLALLEVPAKTPIPDARAYRLALLLIALLASAGVAARVLGRQLTAARLLRTGLAYFLVVTLCTSLNSHLNLWGSEPEGWHGPALLILLFPVVVPVKPTRAALVGVLCTLVDGLGFAIARALGHPPVGPALGFSLFRDDLGALLLAFGVAHLIQGLGLKVLSARRMGHYELEQKLGHGGMGEVWRGRHAMLARPAAIKLIRPQVLAKIGASGQAMMQRRFELEVQATAALRSPHTVDIYDFGVGHDGTLYYVMELLDGSDLHEVVRRHGPLPPERVVHILLHVCHSLHEAHERGLIHRDLKPSNLFLCRYGADYDFVKVLDFGLVKLLEDERDGSRGDGEGLALTAAGAITGTPAFMSPEQAAHREVDGRSDIYLVGCIAYFLLTRTLVFPGPSPAEMMSQHIRVEPEPVSRRCPFRIPGGLESLVMQCLAKQPASRPQDIQDLAARLRLIPLAEPWTQQRARDWWSALARDDADA